MKDEVKVFIGSAAEQIPIVDAIHNNLARVCTPVSWQTGVFKEMEYNFENLMRAVDECDFAVFVFHPNDETILRGKKLKTVRDNVIYEMGLFMRKLGRERTFFLAPDGIEFHQPTDLWGLYPLTYKYNPDNPDNSLKGLQMATEAACNVIKDRITTLLFYKSEEDALRKELRRLEFVVSAAKFMDAIISHAEFKDLDFDSLLGDLKSNFNANCDIIEEKMQVQAVCLYELSDAGDKLVQIGRTGGRTKRFDEYSLVETDNSLVDYYNDKFKNRNRAAVSMMFLDEENSRPQFREWVYEMYWPVNIEKGLIALIKLTCHADDPFPQEKREEIVDHLVKNNLTLFKALRDVCERRVLYGKEARR